MNRLEAIPGYRRARVLLREVRWHHLILGALCFGIALRLIHFGLGRMLWIDEATIALNFVSRDGADFFQPLDFRQFAPPGWMILSDGFWTVTQNLEYGARLPSLLAGLAALIVFWRVVQARFSPPVVFIIVSAFAFSFMPVYYSSEIKPYIFDLLLTIVLFAQALRMLDQDRWSVRDTILLGLTFIIGSSLAMAAPMIIGGVGVVLGLKALRDRHWTAVLIVGASGAIAGLMYLFPALNAHQAQIANSGFDQGGTGDYFNRHFAPFPPTSIGDFGWYFQIVQDTLKPMVGRESAYAFLLMAVLGGIILARKSAWKFALLVSPIAFGFAFSAAQIYPIMARLTLYILPIGLLLAAHTIEKLIAELPARTNWIVFSALLLMNIGSVAWYRYNHMFNPSASPRDISHELQTVSKGIAADEMLIVTAWTLPAFLLYRHAYDLGEVNWTVTDRAECFFEPPINFRNRGRVWYLRGQYEGPGPVRMTQTFDLVLGTGPEQLSLSTIGQRLDRLDLSGAQSAIATPVACPQRPVEDVFLMGGRPPLLAED